MKYAITWEPKGSHFEFTDTIEIKDIDQANDDLHGNACFYDHSYSIWDFSSCNMSKIEPVDLLYTIARDLAAARIRTAFKIGLVAQNPDSLKICRIYVDKCKQLDFPWKFRIFQSVDEAREWCTIDDLWQDKESLIIQSKQSVKTDAQKKAPKQD